MPDSPAVLTLTADEHAAILTLWPDADAFVRWQRDTLAAEIERRVSMAGQEQAEAAVATAMQQTKAAFPSVFGPPEA